MPTLSQPSPLSRLAPLRRIPFWAPALALCALFAIAGVAILDDYGVSGDGPGQRHIANSNADYIATGDISGLSQPWDVAYRYYGIAFEMPLLLAERALGLQDTRHVFLIRHLLTHLFFIAGGFACGMLAYRMIGSRWIALFAMLLFLLHPRLYAHSFFNSKDIPFAVTLLIALCLAHRAFRKDTGGAFLLCGIGVGLAINLRPLALMLPPMILAMRALDLWQAGNAERKRILASAGIFAAAALATLYITHPYYWENPLRFVEGLRVLSQHPYHIDNLFMGEIYRSDAVPWNYIPVWFAITAPPVALTLGAIGCAAACWQAISRPLAALLDRETRFRILLLGCFALPVAVVIILQSNTHQGWRHMYFLWAPFCLLAAVGLHYIANIHVGSGIWKIAARLPGWIRGGSRSRRARRALAYGVAAIGLTTTLTAMAALHPYEHIYFNALVDTKTPGAFAKRYETDYWALTRRQAMEYLLASYPDDRLRVFPPSRSERILPQKDRKRIVAVKSPYSADFYLRTARESYNNKYIANLRHSGFYLHPRIDPKSVLARQPIHSVKAYGSVIAEIFSNYDNLDNYLAAYRDIAANGTLLARSAFDIYAYDDALYYLSPNCDPRAPNAGYWVFLRVIPVDPADLPADSREHGFENRGFRFDWHGAFFDGKCIGKRTLPDYPIDRISTEQLADGEAVWRADIEFAAHMLSERIAAGDYGKPVAQSDFDVYLRGDSLAYLKEPCVPGDTDARFLLHIIPAASARLPAPARDYGFENLNFQFADHGARIGDICVIERQLPAYPIDRIRAGQFVSGGGWLWNAEFPATR